MKYSVKMAITLLLTAVVMMGIIWVFSTSERQFALNQYLSVNQNTADLVQHAVSGSIDDYTDGEGNVDYAGLVNSLEKFNFDSITVLSTTGTVLGSTDSSITGAYIFSLGDDGEKAFFEEKGSNFIANGNSYYFAEIISSDFRVMCVILQSKLLVEETKISILNVVEIIFLILCFSICAFLTIIFYKQKFNVLYRVKPVNNYTLATTKHGKMLYSDNNFAKTFGSVKLSEKIINNNCNFIDFLSSGRMLLFGLTNKDGRERKVAFNVTSGLGQYKMVGSDVTTFMDEHDRLVAEHETDFQTGLKNEIPFRREWQKYIMAGNYKDGMICFLGVQRLDYYEYLYGQKNFIMGYKLILKRIRKYLAEYGELYTIDGYTFLFIKDKETRDKFLANIKPISDYLCQAVKLGKYVIKPETCIGAVFLTSLREDTKFEYVLSAGRKALNYTLVTPNMPYYVQRSTNFGETLQSLTSERLQELIRKGSLDVYFQPQVNPFKEKVVGLEGLLRITDPTLKDIKIPDFIEMAERSGCIVDLGEFIYNKCMDFAATIQDYGVSVSINISPIQFMQAGFCEKFLEEYNKRNLKANSIHVEILESTIIYSLDDVIKKLNILRKNHIAVEVDDFGVAYSCMSYLKNLPINTLKIDMGFIKGIVESEPDRLLVKNMINITKDLKLECVAEGVETKEQLDVLKKLNCDIIQGYYYSKALPREQVIEYINKMNKKGEQNGK